MFKNTATTALDLSDYAFHFTDTSNKDFTGNYCHTRKKQFKMSDISKTATEKLN